MLARDQGGIVWYGSGDNVDGFMSRELYEHYRAKNGELPKYEDLELFDNRDQNIVGVD